MLFYITEEIASEAEKNNLRVIEVLEFVAQSHLYGRHIMFSSRVILERLSKLSFFNDKRTISVFKAILSKYSTFGNILKVISLRVQLILGEQFQVLTDADGYKIIYCPIICKSLENLMMGTELLGENVEEIFMYGFMGKYYLQKVNMQINTFYKELHGGGDTLYIVLKKEAEKESFCLAFLDSDKKWDGGSIGTTLKKVKADCSRNKYCTVSYIYSDLYREIENMIPLKILEEVSQKSVDWFRGFKDVNAIVKGGIDVQYYDMKYGMTLKKYRKLKDKIQERDYVDKQLSCLHPESDNHEKWMDNLPEDEIILHGLGDEVLKRSVKYLEDNFDCWSENACLDPILEQEWIRIGREFINWSCASSKIRV